MNSPGCGVCGDAMDLVQCVTCASRQHKDCYQLVRKCGTFGCDGVLRPTPGSAACAGIESRLESAHGTADGLIPSRDSPQQGFDEVAEVLARVERYSIRKGLFFSGKVMGYRFSSIFSGSAGDPDPSSKPGAPSVFEGLDELTKARICKDYSSKESSRAKAAGLYGTVVRDLLIVKRYDDAMKVARESAVFRLVRQASFVYGGALVELGGEIVPSSGENQVLLSKFHAAGSVFLEGKHYESVARLAEGLKRNLPEKRSRASYYGDVGVSLEKNLIRALEKERNLPALAVVSKILGVDHPYLSMAKVISDVDNDLSQVDE